MHNKPDRLVIVGGGVIGLSTAYYALRDGREVTVLERGPAEATNCSSGNAGMIVPSHFTPLAAPGVLGKGLRWMFNPQSPLGIRPSLSPDLLRWLWLFSRHATRPPTRAVSRLLCELNLESRRLFEELSENSDFGLNTRGLLMLCQTPAALAEEAELASRASSLGLTTEVLDAAGAARLDPAIEMDIAGAVHFADDAHLDPARFMQALRSRIGELGGTIVHDFPVDHIDTRNGRAVAAHGPQGCHEAEQFVIAGGAWTPSLVRQIGLKLPLQPGKGYSITLPSPPQLPRLCSILTEAKVAVTPMGQSLRIAGTMEIGGVDDRIHPGRLRGIIRSVRRYFPQFAEVDFDDLAVWSGLRPISPDGIPYLGRTPRHANLIVATGHAMMGLSLAPISGKLVADLLAGRPSSPAIDRLDPARFG